LKEFNAEKNKKAGTTTNTNFETGPVLTLTCKGDVKSGEMHVQT